jgi:hypothetical protein
VPQTLGLTFLVGFGVSLWSANAGMKSLFDIMYGEEEERGFVKLNAISLLFTVGGILERPRAGNAGPLVSRLGSCRSLSPRARRRSTKKPAGECR